MNSTLTQLVSELIDRYGGPTTTHRRRLRDTLVRLLHRLGARQRRLHLWRRRLELDEADSSPDVARLPDLIRLVQTDKSDSLQRLALVSQAAEDLDHRLDLTVETLLAAAMERIAALERAQQQPVPAAPVQTLPAVEPPAPPPDLPERTTEPLTIETCVQVNSRLQAFILHLVGSEGLARVWRILERALAAGAAGSANGVRNAIKKLIDKDLLACYSEKGRPVNWSGGQSGPPRQLLILSPTGQTWYRHHYGREPAECELYAAAQRHQSIAHAVAILETRDRLTARGFEVDEHPAPHFLDAARPQGGPHPVGDGTRQSAGRRSEPDLGARIAGQWWPVEVQIDIASPRRLMAKWEKALAASGRLVIVLLNAAKQQRQVDLIRQARRERVFDASATVYLSNLEAMEANPDWQWTQG